MFKTILVRNALLLPVAGCAAAAILSNDMGQRALFVLGAIVLEYARDMLGLMAIKKK